MNNQTSSFIYFACQQGAEKTIKNSLCEPVGPYRLAYSQKGFVTLKSNLSTPAWSKALPTHPLVRSHGHVLGKFDGDVAEPLIDKILSEFVSLDWEHMHVWQRDIAIPGWNGFEPGRSALATFLSEKFNESLQARGDSRRASSEVQHPKDSRMIEIIIDEPNRWWVAAHMVSNREEGWPGGVYAVPIPEDMISRAYLKLAEAIAWSGIEIRAGDRVVEIGSSPGGACQYLLDLGAKVTGIDPAEMDPRVSDHPGFTHWRARSIQVKRKDFAPFRFLICDANVAPNYTLDTIEAIVTYPTSKMEGLILTMKLASWDQADRIPDHLERVRKWGFSKVEARQLAHNRKEYCLTALRQ
jgi:23S rRNA (cytidine2498-2'-O)-methyltransferase